jgi:pyruvate-formate lyase
MAKITLADPWLSEFSLASLPLLEQLRCLAAAGEVEVCIERARHITTYLRDLADPQDARPLRYAKAVRCFLSNKAPRFQDANLLAGTTTSRPIGAIVCPETTRNSPGSGLEHLERGRNVRQQVSRDVAEELDLRLLPYWRGRGLGDATRARLPSALQLRSRLVLIVGDQAGTLAQTAPCLRLALERGLGWMIRQAAETEQTMLERGHLEEADRQRAIQETLTGLVTYAANLGQFAALLAEDESDPARRQQLKLMAAVCTQVPAGPARTFREAVNALWLLLIGLQAENLDPLPSPGRLDQLLYPWYRKDAQSGLLSVREALELIGCLWLKFGDHRRIASELCGERFGGSALAAEVTLGGIDEQGEDAVNDLTYIMLRATELLAPSEPRVQVRLNRTGNSTLFQRRVDQAARASAAVSTFHEDDAVIAELEGRGFSPGQARGYALLGCEVRALPGGCAGSWKPEALVQPPALEGAGCGDAGAAWTAGIRTGMEGASRCLERGWAAFRRQLSWNAG